MTKYVLSTSKKEFEGLPEVVGSEIKQAIDQIKRQDGKNIWLYGGAKLITTFLDRDLIVEFRLAIYPVILGNGKPLFNEIRESKKLNLVNQRAIHPE